MTMSKTPTPLHHAQRGRGAHAQAQALWRSAPRWALPLLPACLACLMCLVAGCAATAPDNAPPVGNAQPGAVSVTFAEPMQSGDARNAPRETDKARRAWLDALALHLAERAAPRLREGQRLEVQITDVQRAGGFEPWRGPQAGQVRIVRDIYPPRIDLRFKLIGPDGNTLREGPRQLRDSAFLMRPGTGSSDTLQHEKALLDDWVDKEFARKG